MFLHSLLPYKISQTWFPSTKEYNSQEDDYFWSQRGDRSMRGRCPPGGVIGPPVDIDINHIVLSSLKFIMWLWVILGGRAGCQEVFVKFLSLLKCVWSSSKSKFFVPNFEPGPEVNFECVHTLPVLDWSDACRSRSIWVPGTLESGTAVSGT